MENTTQDADYAAGYAAMMAMHDEAVRRGWRTPPARRIVTEILWLERSATRQRTSSSALPVLEQPLYPEGWYRGRADALRELLRRAEEHG